MKTAKSEWGSDSDRGCYFQRRSSPDGALIQTGMLISKPIELNGVIIHRDVDFKDD
ncbi:hypothetical protein [Bacillus salipaludis]|uniref:hypothetical protein n=1 Tax=Bacillus salipaludis TaxID=2547811 RepID=UPI00140458A1|nr:hypothetical protein [Bacillus salipaludis]